MNKFFFKPNKNKILFTTIFILLLFYCFNFFFPILDTIKFYMFHSEPFQWQDIPCTRSLCPLYPTYPKLLAFIVFMLAIIIAFSTVSYVLSCLLFRKKQARRKKS